MTPAEFWGSIRASGLTAEQELVELWQRLRDCRPKKPVVLEAGGGGASIGSSSGPDAQIPLREWLRRYGPVAQPPPAAAPVRRNRRRREEEELLVMLKARP